MTATTRDVASIVRAESIDILSLEAALNAMSEPQRVAAARRWCKGDMVRLWEATEGRGVTAEDFVPATVPPTTQVIHKGKNSLPLFSKFQKRFTGVAGQPGVVYGYNHNWFNWTTAGPGYFIGHHDDAYGEFGLDYYEVPPRDAQLPPGWPRIYKNERGLQRFIYAKMIDYMRKIAEGVTIGRAVRKRKMTSNYFVLVRTGV